jgi:SH3-like domain-containing protein
MVFHSNSTTAKHLRWLFATTYPWICFGSMVMLTTGVLPADEPQGQVSTKSSSSTLPQASHRFVHSHRATVRCGPSDEYYSTAALERGTPVEVYVETTDGWSGIRPPEGSHDWIPADSVYLLPGARIAEVSVERVAAWVGSDSPKNEKLLYQTELIQTQTVSILGEAYRGPEEDRKLWFRIAPPQGEFRWVRTEHLGTEPIAKEISKKNVGVSMTTSPKNITGSGVKKASYQPPSKDSSNAPTESTGEGEIVWSDETEQLSKIDREIEREQQELNRTGKGTASKSPKNPSATPKRTSSSQINAHNASNKIISLQTTESKSNNRSHIPTEGEPKTRPITGPESEEQYWQAMQRQANQRQAKQPKQQQRDIPAPSGAMGNMLGLLGISVIDSNPKGANAQSTNSLHPIPRREPTRNASPTYGDGYTSIVNGYDPADGSSRLDRLPRPRSRYSTAKRNSLVADRQADSSSLLNTILNSREPLWGNTDEQRVVDTASNDPASTPIGVSPPISAVSYLNPNSSMPLSGSRSSDWEQPERFQSPQIQEALLQLSSIVSRPTSEWHLAPVRDTALFWIERGETPLLRGEARLLMDRIDRFESIRQRTAVMGGAPSIAGPIRIPSIGGPTGALPAVAPNATMPSNFSVSNASGNNYTPTAPYTEAVPQRTIDSASELSGWLVAMHTSVPGQPEFALTDDAGSLIAYVRSTTGLNLRRYVQQPVTVFGTRGYIPNLAAKQIVADRVVRIR